MGVISKSEEGMTSLSKIDSPRFLAICVHRIRRTRQLLILGGGVGDDEGEAEWRVGCDVRERGDRQRHRRSGGSREHRRRRFGEVGTEMGIGEKRNLVF